MSAERVILTDFSVSNDVMVNGESRFCLTTGRFVGKTDQRFSFASDIVNVYDDAYNRLNMGRFFMARSQRCGLPEDNAGAFENRAQSVNSSPVTLNIACICGAPSIDVAKDVCAAEYAGSVVH
jgi:hypothetical protein